MDAQRPEPTCAATNREEPMAEEYEVPSHHEHHLEHEASHGPGLSQQIAIFTAILGFYIAYLFYYKKPRTAAAIAAKYPTVYRVVANKFYVDEIYHTVLVTPLLMFTRTILGGLIDLGIVNGSGYFAASTTRGLSFLTRRIQSGNIRSYAGWLALGDRKSTHLNSSHERRSRMPSSA